MKLGRIGKFAIIFMCLLSANATLAEFKSNNIPLSIRALVKNYEHKQSALQGGAVALLYRDRIIYKTTFGKQKDNSYDITSQTLFALASVSKPITAIATALLVEDKKLHFEDRFKLLYLQQIVTLKNLLSHTTGYQFSGNGYIEQGVSRKRLLRILKRQKPKCRPNQCYRYSNTMFSLVSEALKTKNFNFHSLIHKLQATLRTDGIQVIPIDPIMSIAYPHTKKMINKKGWFKSLPFPPYYPVTVPASAGVFASLDGMVEFAKLSFGYRPDLISPKTLKLIYTPIISNRDIDKWNNRFPCNKNKILSYYAMGWRILEIKEHPDKKLIFHSGQINGTRAFIGFVPSKEITIIILGNQSSAFPVEYGLDIWARLTDIK